MVVCDICGKECKNEDFNALHIHSGKLSEKESVFLVIDICYDCKLKIRDNRKKVREIICKSIGEANLRIRDIC